MNNRKYEKASAYNNEKKNKQSNFLFLNNNYCEKGQVVLIGDSITELFNSELFDTFRAESGLKVYNRGISGDMTRGLGARLDENLFPLEPKAVVLMIGTNDLSVGASVDFVFEKTCEIIRRIRENAVGVKLIVQSVLPVCGNLSAELKCSKNKKIIELNGKLTAYCKKENITFVDHTVTMSDSKGNLNPDYTYDGLHPNARGFELMARKIIPELKGVTK